jgi:hypothetical protein
MRQKNYLGDDLEISVILGALLDTPFVLIPSPGGFYTLLVKL